jgi:osmotically-inducible protein OsmY
MATTKTPPPQSAKEDRELEQRVLQFLAGMQRTPLRAIDVQVERGQVTLSGKLPSFYDKQLCLRCLQQVAGVVRLIDQIEVRYSV